MYLVIENKKQVTPIGVPINKSVVIPIKKNCIVPNFPRTKIQNNTQINYERKCIA